MTTETQLSLEALKNQKAIIGNIAEKAMIIGYKFSRWGATKASKRAADIVCSNMHVTKPNLARVRHDLIENEAFLEIDSAIRVARDYIWANTSPWLDDGTRIFKAEKVFEIASALNEYRTNFNYAVDRFINDKYPVFRESIREYKGDLFDSNDYPSPQNLKKKFGFEIYGPFRVPIEKESKQQWIIQYSQQELDWLQNQANESVARALGSVHNDIIKRVVKRVAEMPDKLRKYHVDEEGKAHHAFKNSVITNLVDVLDLAKELNVTDSAELNTIIDEIRHELCEHTGEQLKDDEQLRTDVAKRAEEILKQMQNFI